MTGLQGKAAPTCSERLKAHTLRVAENDKPPHKRQPGNDCPPKKSALPGWRVIRLRGQSLGQDELPLRALMWNST
jgi:hypothetical protein